MASFEAPSGRIRDTKRRVWGLVSVFFGSPSDRICDTKRPVWGLVWGSFWCLRVVWESSGSRRQHARLRQQQTVPVDSAPSRSTTDQPTQGGDPTPTYNRCIPLGRRAVPFVCVCWVGVGSPPTMQPSPTGECHNRRTHTRHPKIGHCCRECAFLGGGKCAGKSANRLTVEDFRDRKMVAKKSQHRPLLP